LYYSNDGNQAQQTAFSKENAHEIKAKTTTTTTESKAKIKKIAKSNLDALVFLFAGIAMRRRKIIRSRNCTQP